MVNLVQGLFIPTYNLAKGRDLTGFSLSRYEARKEAKKLLNAIFKVSISLGGFFALSAFMHKIAPKHSLLGACVLTGGCAFLSQQRVSPLIASASTITAGLFIIRAGVGDLVLSPLVQSVKAALHWVAEPQVSLNLALSCVSGIACGFFRLVGGLASLGLGLYVMDRTSQQGPKSRHFFDRGVRYLSKKCASGLVALFGYKKYIPPAPIQPVRLFQK